MKRQKILLDVVQHIMRETAAASTERNDAVDLVLQTHRMAADETALKALCTKGGGKYIYW